MGYLKTSEVAKAVGVHSNTVRLYEELGLLQPVPRNDNGYRLYTTKHLEQMRLARLALRCEFCAANIRGMSISIVKTAARDHLNEALDEALNYLEHIRNELTRAEEALILIKKWIQNELDEDSDLYFKRIDVARLLGVSIDVLRNWERNGLIDIPRNPGNGYRVYRPQEINKLKVIRTLRAANYSMMSILRMLKHMEKGGIGDFNAIFNSFDENEDMTYATDRLIKTLKKVEYDALEIITQLKKMNKNV